MTQLLGESAVVSQDQEALGLDIEATDMKQPRKLRRQKIEDGIPCVGILAGRGESGWLMEDKIDGPFGLNQLAIDLDVVAPSRFSAEIGTDLAVDGDASVRDQLIAMPA